VYRSITDEQQVDVMRHLANESNDSRIQDLLAATISKDSADTKRYLSKAWNGKIVIFILYRTQCVQQNYS